MITNDSLEKETVDAEVPPSVAEPAADPGDVSEAVCPPCISVILPVYNVEPYIRRCIESLQDQTMDELEFIFVDDCATDGSMTPVEEWAARDSRVRIIHNEGNIGAGPSRNRGIEAARGDYLSFIDSDDYVSPDFYELLYELATSDGGHDMAKGMRIRVDYATGEPISNCVINEQIRIGLSRKTPLYSLFHYDFFSCIYKRALFVSSEARFGGELIGEDRLFLLRCTYQSNDIVITDQPTYFYVQHPGSRMHTFDAEGACSLTETLAKMISFLEKRGIDGVALRYLSEMSKSTIERLDEFRFSEQISSKTYLDLAEKTAALVRAVPGLEELALEKPQLKRLMRGHPFAIPGRRFPSEGEVRVSVILPVFNPGPKIGKCIESLRQQLLDGLEFIFVDDRVADDAMSAVEEWAARDDRVRILRNTQSRGAGASCNRGIEVARGDYLSFVDPDDYLSPDFYELLYGTAIDDGGHDIVKGRRVEHRPDGTIVRGPSIELNKSICSVSQGDKPLYEVFVSEHRTAIYRRAIMEAGAHCGTGPYGCGTVLLFSAALRTEDIVIEELAEYHSVRPSEAPATTSVSKRYVREFCPLADMVAALDGAPDVRGVRSYLGDKVRLLLGDYCMACLEDPSLNTQAGTYAQKVAEALVSSSVLWFPSSDDLVIRALAETGVALPYVDRLTPEQKTAGALKWIDFITSHPDVASRYIDECAMAMANALQLAFSRSGRAGFADTYSQLAKKTESLSASQRAGLWMKAFRRLMTRHNLDAVAKKARKKLKR